MTLDSWPSRCLKSCRYFRKCIRTELRKSGTPNACFLLARGPAPDDCLYPEKQP